MTLRISDAIGPQIAGALRGDGSTWQQNQLVPIIADCGLQDGTANNQVGGAPLLRSETTEQVLRKRLSLSFNV